jgi:hypothetical protein
MVVGDRLANTLGRMNTPVILAKVFRYRCAENATSKNVPLPVPPAKLPTMEIYTPSGLET